MTKQSRFSKQEQKRLERQRKKRNEKYLKQKHKQEKKNKNKDEKNEANQPGPISKFFSAISHFLSLFIPTNSPIAHNRLIRQGALFGACLMLLISGFFIAKKGYDHKQYILSQAQSFMSSDLAFSKTNTPVKTNVSPFMTQNKKTLYIPLTISDISNVDTDASKYHILIMPANGNVLKTHIATAQLISYGSTGRMALVVDSANKIKSQLVQILLWSGSNLTDDKYDPSEDDSIQNQNQTAINDVKAKYDMLAFTINLGGTSIPAIHKTSKVKAVKLVKHYHKKGKHKKVYFKRVPYLKTVPDPQGQYLYNNNKLQYIYNRIYSQKRLAKTQRKIKSRYSAMDVDIARIRRDYSSLKSAGYNIPKLPDWANTKANNLTDGLPVTYDTLLGATCLNQDSFATSKDKLKILDKAYDSYQKNNDDNDDASDNNSAGGSDGNGTDLTQLNIKEAKEYTKLQNMVLKNKITHTQIGVNTDKDSSKTNANTNGDEKQWEDYLDNLSNIIAIKYAIYYQYPLQMWGEYKLFLQATSSASNFSRKANVGQITYSKTHGYNEHGRYLTILGLNHEMK